MLCVLLFPSKRYFSVKFLQEYGGVGLWWLGKFLTFIFSKTSVLLLGCSVQVTSPLYVKTQDTDENIAKKSPLSRTFRANCPESELPFSP